MDRPASDTRQSNTSQHMPPHIPDLPNEDQGQEASPAPTLGYGSSPPANRFKRGQSGNPKGRPKGAKNKGLPYDAVLGRLVTVRENGQERTVTAAEALLLKLTQRGLKFGGSVAQQLAGVLHTQRERLEQERKLEEGMSIALVGVAPGSVNSALQDLRMGKIRDVRRPSAKMFLEPWIVTRALERFGERRLSVEEQIEVLGATRTPHKVIWPSWWQALPE